ncbi:hypothetical protein [Numidum massiliense]|uniref:hypothetical protein n=1 Tax=Numidum massiliense TaxID=1522315 RepID=UPI0006D549A2|nr:hypothetical protein [Numidum massiliense]
MKPFKNGRQRTKQSQPYKPKARRSLPPIEDTEFASEGLVNKAIQRSYRQSGRPNEPLDEE